MDTDFKLGLMNGFMAGNKKLVKITLSANMLNNLEILSQMFINKVLKEIVLVQQSYFKTSLMSPKEPNTSENFKFPDTSSNRNEEYLGVSKAENRTLEKLTLGLGLMCTIKPLIQCF